MKKTHKKRSRNIKPISRWCKLTIIAIVILFFWLVFLESKIDEPEEPTSYIISGAIGVTTGFVLIGMLFGYINKRMASKINKSVNIAYLLGFVFNMIGIIAYGIYYTYHKEKLEGVIPS